jgi:ribosomal protein L19
MIKNITKQTAAPKFNVGDKIEFYYGINERGMTTAYRTIYGVITKLNQKTAIVRTATDEYKIDQAILNLYVDPFQYL